MNLKIIQLLMFFVAAIILSATFNSILLKFSKSLGIRNNNDILIRWSNQSKPSIGGISFFVVFIFTSIGYSFVFSDEYIFHNLQYVGLMSAASLAFAMGLADDAYNTKPLIKFSIQILCGILFNITNTTIHLFENELINQIFTVFYVITLMNSLNMLDNMDGITGTTSVFILLTCLASSFILFELNRNIWSILLITQVGAIIGFLFFNINPSKMFMGDSGSQFIGLIVAFFSIKFLINIGEIINGPKWSGLIICLLALTPTAVDSITVTINRIIKGKSPMVGGKDHTTHFLVYAGLKDKQVWYVFILISFLSSLLSIFLIYLTKIHIFLPIIIFTIYFIVIFILLYRLTFKFKDKANL